MIENLLESPGELKYFYPTAAEQDFPSIVVEAIHGSASNYNLATLDSVEMLEKVPVNTVVTKDQKNKAHLLASEEVPDDNEEEEYLIGRQFSMITTN